MLKKKLEAFVENIISFPVFSEIEDRKALKEFLNNEIYEFYNHAPLKIKEFIENNNPDNLIKSIYLKNLGIETEDLDLFIGISLSMISKFFINKNSTKSLISLLDFLRNMGFNTSIYKIIWDGIQDKWILENIETRELVDSNKFEIKNQEDIFTSGHLIATKEYLDNSSSTYTTPLVLITYTQSVSILEEFTPPSLLVAYAISKYGDDDIQVFTGSNSYNITIKDFLLISRYIYLRWLQSRNAGFDVIEPDKEYWYLERDDTFIEEAYNLLNFLYNEVKTSQEFDQYVRRATQLLKYYTTYKGSGSIDDIHDYLHDIHPELIDEIDSIDPEEMIKYFNMNFRYYILNKIAQTDDKIEIRSILTLNYLFSIVYNSIRALDIQKLIKVTHIYKKYFLPIYTEFCFYIDKSYKIKNMLMKFYVTDKWYSSVIVNNSELTHLSDKHFELIETAKNDYMLLRDYVNYVVLIKFIDKISVISDHFFEIIIQTAEIQYSKDNHKLNFKYSKKDRTKFVDQNNVQIRTRPTSTLDFLNNFINNIFAGAHGVIKQNDDHKEASVTHKGDKVNNSDYVIATKIKD